MKGVIFTRRFFRTVYFNNIEVLSSLCQIKTYKYCIDVSDTIEQVATICTSEIKAEVRQGSINRYVWVSSKRFINPFLAMHFLNTEFKGSASEFR